MIIDRLEKINDGVKNQIHSFDFKAEIFLTVNGVLLGLFIVNDIVSKIQKNLWTLIIFVFFFTFALVSLIFFAVAIFPRSKKNTLKKSKLHYFDIAKMQESDFNKFDENEYIKELQNQIINNSIVCRKKHFWVMYGIIFLLISIVFASIGWLTLMI